MERIAIFPGSFDPFTRGHEDIVKKASKLFDKVIISIGKHSAKKRYFEIDLMIANDSAPIYVAEAFNKATSA